MKGRKEFNLKWYFYGLILGVFILIEGGALYSHSKISKSFAPDGMVLSKIITEPSLTPRLKSTKNTNTLVKSAYAEDKNAFCLKVPVLLYHHIKPLEIAKIDGHPQLTVDVSYFDSQMKYLVDNGYVTLTADELISSLIDKKKLPDRSIVVTLDDGYDDVYTYAYPIAKKYNVKLNLMIATGLIGNPGYLNWDQLEEMSKSGLIFAYNHTWSHYSLPNGDEKKIVEEITIAHKQLEEQLGISSKVFTYPYGSYNQLSFDILKRRGYIGAFTTEHSFTQCDSHLMTLHRDHVGNAPLSFYGL